MLSYLSIRISFWFWLYKVAQTAWDTENEKPYFEFFVFFFKANVAAVWWWVYFFLFSGNDEVTVLEVSWPDDSSLTRTLQPGEMNSVVEIAYPKEGERSVLANDTQVRRTDPRHELWTPVISQSASVNGFSLAVTSSVQVEAVLLQISAEDCCCIIHRWKLVLKI